MNTTHELSAVVAHQRRKALCRLTFAIGIAVAILPLYGVVPFIGTLAVGALTALAMHLWDGEQAAEWWEHDDE